mmetsp:Transcript_14422/g.31588  ORF Transcript_14422/g.31588 Transcript_14422/m.31588 type:complete len:218 (+) Transcript_14422:829-1482(+)
MPALQVRHPHMLHRRSQIAALGTHSWPLVPRPLGLGWHSASRPLWCEAYRGLCGGCMGLPRRGQLRQRWSRNPALLLAMPRLPMSLGRNCSKSFRHVLKPRQIANELGCNVLRQSGSCKLRSNPAPNSRAALRGKSRGVDRQSVKSGRWSLAASRSSENEPLFSSNSRRPEGESEPMLQNSVQQGLPWNRRSSSGRSSVHAPLPWRRTTAGLAAASM